MPTPRNTHSSSNIFSQYSLSSSRVGIMDEKNKKEEIERESSSKYWTLKYKAAFLFGGSLVCCFFYYKIGTYSAIPYILGFPIGGLVNVFLVSMLTLEDNNFTNPPGGW